MKKTVLADIRIDGKCEGSLLDRGYEVIKVPPSPCLAPPVASHPDMIFFAAKGALVCERGYYETYPETVELIAGKGGLRLVLAEESLSHEYPGDVLFNAAPIGERLICRTSAVSSAVRGLYPKEKIIDVKQGYSKCACLTVGESGVITADPSVAKPAELAGLSVLRLKAHGVRLDGYGTGFIGGAAGDDGENILFCGDLSLHPEGEAIADFCTLHGRHVISLSDEELYDYGTLMFI